MTPLGIPAQGLALFDALRFTDPNPEALRALSDSEWQRLLKFCDRAQVTLLLGYLCQEHLPHWVRARITRNRAGYERRFATLQARVLEIADTFSACSIPFVLLKGFAQGELFAPQSVLRGQGDIDIWCLPESIERAHRTVRELGYRSAGVSNRRHLPPMIRETQWEWREDYFAPDLPIPIDLHYQLWDSDREHFSGPDEAELWNRRICVSINGHDLLVLDPADALAFGAFHLLMHLLHGDLRLQRAWEIAFFLETHSDDKNFWMRWERLYPPAVLRPQLIIFLLVHLWFRCKLPRPVAPRISELAPDISRWIQRFGFSPVENLFTPNKHELLLNLYLVDSRRDQFRIALRRLFPLNSAGILNAAGTPLARCAFILRRIAHHGRTLPWRHLLLY